MLTKRLDVSVYMSSTVFTELFQHLRCVLFVLVVPTIAITFIIMWSKVIG